MLPVGLAAGYVVGIAALLASLGIWRPGLRKDAVLWFLFAGIALTFAGLDRAAERRGYWRRLVLNQVKVTLIFEWLINEYTYPLSIELLLLPSLVLLIAADTIARSDSALNSVATLTSWLLAALGFMLVAHGVQAAVSHLDTFAVGFAIRTMLIGPILSLAMLPLAFALSLCTAYETLLLRLRFTLAKKGEPDLIAYAARRIVWRCGLRPRKISQFWRAYVPQLEGLKSRAEVDAVLNLSKSGRRGIDNQGYLVRPELPKVVNGEYI